MMLRFRLAGALVAVLLLTGCGAALPGSEPNNAPVSAPTVAPQPSPTPPQVSVQPPTAPKPPERPGTSASGTANAGLPATAPAPGATTPAPTAPVVAAPTQGQALAFTSLQRGAYSGIRERKAVLISDEAAWRSNWQQLSAHQVPAPAAPAMDFTQHSVLAVYMGEKNTGGHSIEITGVEVSGGKLKVTVQQTTPGPGAMVTQALTQPYHMVQIPKVPAGTAVEVNW
ncbi:MAG: hypothetical protein K0R39_484 [Symbiobacteriaceae bacterium]|jgi:hypothetical protein|nr:hypothetical protein [Symbiobacteriaceae bacterium]